MTTTVPPALATGSYQIDPAASTIQFRTAHLLGLGPVDGTFAIRSGWLRIDADSLRSRVEATIDAASFHTDKPRRDTDITGRRFLNAVQFPDIVFHGTQLRADSDGWELTGTLTVRAQSAPVALRIMSAEANADGLRATASARVDRYAHGITAGRPVVGRFIDLSLDVRATRVTSQ